MAKHLIKKRPWFENVKESDDLAGPRDGRAYDIPKQLQLHIFNHKKLNTKIGRLHQQSNIGHPVCRADVLTITPQRTFRHCAFKLH